MVFWPFFGTKINSFPSDLNMTRPDPTRPDPTRPEPTRPDPPDFPPKNRSFIIGLSSDTTRPDPLDFSLKNRQFHYKIAIRPTTPDPDPQPPTPAHDPTNPDPTNVLREERKDPIIPRFSGGGYVTFWLAGDHLSPKYDVGLNCVLKLLKSSDVVLFDLSAIPPP